MAELCETLASHAPTTLRVTKEALRRLRDAGTCRTATTSSATPTASPDFRASVERFLPIATCGRG